jgi:hypothetical protein
MWVAHSAYATGHASRRARPSAKMLKLHKSDGDLTAAARVPPNVAQPSLVGAANVEPTTARQALISTTGWDGADSNDPSRGRQTTLPAK